MRIKTVVGDRTITTRPEERPHGLVYITMVMNDKNGYCEAAWESYEYDNPAGCHLFAAITEQQRDGVK